MNAPREIPAAALAGAATVEVRWQDVPVFVFVRDLPGPTRELVTWLLEAGTRHVVLVDCGSSDPALQAWYRALPAGAELLRLGGDAGTATFWAESVHLRLGLPFIVAEAGYVPGASCPTDLVARMLDVLRRYPDCGKVAASVRVDDLGDDLVDAELIRRWETQFWMNPVDDDLFAAPTESGFCLYPAGGPPATGPRNLRVAGPYRVEYRPWYRRPGDAAAPVGRAAWGPEAKRLKLRRSAAVLAYDYRPKVLGLRGDRPPVPGWLNAGPAGSGCAIRLDGRGAATLHGPLPAGGLDGIHWPVAHGVPEPDAGLLETVYRAARHEARLWLRLPLSTLERTLSVVATQGWRPGIAEPAFDWRLETCALVGGPDPLAAVARGDEAVLTFRACKPARRADEMSRAPAVQPTQLPDRRAPADFTCV
ncbi:MAG: hypothetical protein ACOYLX_02805 [Burkholderiaceae bacterium]